MTEALISRLSDQGYNLVIEGTGEQHTFLFKPQQCFKPKVMKQKCMSWQYLKSTHI